MNHRLVEVGEGSPSLLLDPLLILTTAQAQDAVNLDDALPLIVGKVDRALDEQVSSVHHAITFSRE